MKMKFSYPPKFHYEKEPSIWQNPVETSLLLRWLRDNEVFSILEIGMGHGRFGILLESHNYSIVGIDRIEPKAKIVFDAYTEVITGNSTLKETVQKAMNYAPYDVVFIDGNHSESVVELDWWNYSKMASKAVVFHDIAGNRNGKYKTSLGVKKFWSKIKKEFPTIEINDAEPFNCGLGIILKGEENAKKSDLCY